MKKYIKSASLGNITLYNYINQNRDKLQGKEVLISCLEPYDVGYPDDVPGVLFVGTLDELDATASRIEENLGDNYLTLSDLHRVVVTSVTYTLDSVEIRIGNWV